MRLDPPILLAIGAGAVPLAQAGFSVYAPYDKDPIAQALGISSGCLAYLNQTIECDAANAARAANGARNQYWVENDLKSLCTGQCSSSLNAWYSSVEDACSGDMILVNGKEVEPKLLPERYIKGYNAVCLKDSVDNWCILESQKWYHNDIPDSKPEQPLDVAAVIENFSRDQYCSECFFLMWKEKIIQPSGDASHTAQLERQFQDLVEQCAADNYLLDRRQLSNVKARNRKHHRIEPRASRGTYLTLPEGTPVLDQTIRNCAKYYVLEEGDTCHGIARKLGVSLPYLMNLNHGIDKHCTTLWTGYAICVTEGIPGAEKVVEEKAPAPVPEDAPIVVSPATDATFAVETPASEKRQMDDTVEDLSSEISCECYDGENKNSCYERCQPQMGPTFLKKPRISIDGKCSKDVTCKGSKFGECCSTSGYCGNSPAHCGYGNCQHGACNKAVGQVSSDGKCGPKFPGNLTCVGSRFGDCCSVYGFCGSGPNFCALGACYSGQCSTWPAKSEEKTQPVEGDAKKTPTKGGDSKDEDGNDEPAPGDDKDGKDTPDEGNEIDSKPSQDDNEQQKKKGKATDGGDSKQDDGDKKDSPDGQNQDVPVEEDKKEDKPSQQIEDGGKKEKQENTPEDGKKDGQEEFEGEAKILDARSAKVKRSPAQETSDAYKRRRIYESAPSTPAFVKAQKKVTTDGRCSEGVSCQGSGFGSCCSKSGYCGDGPLYCGLDSCLSGACDTSINQVSRDGRCGPKWSGNKTCVGSKWGDCCSNFGFCGNSIEFCAPSACYSGACLRLGKGGRPDGVEDAPAYGEPETEPGDAGEDAQDEQQKKTTPADKDKEGEPVDDGDDNKDQPDEGEEKKTPGDRDADKAPEDNDNDDQDKPNEDQENKAPATGAKPAKRALVPFANRAANISTNGRCNHEVSCIGSDYGDCCSKSGYCGSGPAYCGVNQCAFGACDATVGQVSFDGRCGPRWIGNMTCEGSQYGSCCSIYGFCGNGPEFCSSAKCVGGACDSSDVSQTKTTPEEPASSSSLPQPLGDKVDAAAAAVPRIFNRILRA